MRHRHCSLYNGGMIHAQTPGSHDVITFDQNASGAGELGGVAHFGFRLLAPGDIDAAAQEVERAGGKILRRASSAPGIRMPTWPTRTVMRSRAGTSERRER